MSPTRLERAGAALSRTGSLSPSSPALRRALYASIGATIALSIALAAWSTLGEMPGVEWSFRPGWVALAAAAFASLILLYTELWRQLLHALGPTLPGPQARAAWCVSSVGRYVPTSLLMPVMRAALAERSGVPKRICYASVVYELALSFTGILALSAYFVIDSPSLRDNPERFAVLILPAVALVALQPACFQRVADRTLATLGRETLPKPLSASRVFLFAGAYTAAPILGGISVYGIAHLVYPVEPSDVAVMMGAFAVGTALSLIAFIIPGGLVAREAGLALALAPAMPAVPALAVAVLLRILQLGIETLLAVVTPLLARGAPRDRVPSRIGREADDALA